jgi:hypothetical protein
MQWPGRCAGLSVQLRAYFKSIVTLASLPVNLNGRSQEGVTGVPVSSPRSRPSSNEKRIGIVLSMRL